MTAQAECGHICPMTMTSASVAALAHAPELAERWLPVIRSRQYDSSARPLAEKSGVTIGMGMTEKQGGSDVSSNTTRAEDSRDGLYRITGHKWFMSAPMSDAFLVLAQARGGPLLLPDAALPSRRQPQCHPSHAPQGQARQPLERHRRGRVRRRRGVADRRAGRAASPTILDMVTLTRLDCAVASAGLMRMALAEAIHHVRHRKAFGALLIDQPLMTRVIADMALDAVAAAALVFRLAESYDRAGNDPSEAAFARLMTPAVKYWVTKMAPSMIGEAMECLGGNGYVEESRLPRLYREAPVNAIWEGAGNIMCLDVMRVAPEIVRAARGGARQHRGRARRHREVDAQRAPRGDRRRARRRGLGPHPDRAARHDRRRRRAPPALPVGDRRRLHRDAPRQALAHDLRHARLALRSPPSSTISARRCRVGEPTVPGFNRAANPPLGGCDRIRATGFVVPGAAQHEVVRCRAGTPRE